MTNRLPRKLKKAIRKGKYGIIPAIELGGKPKKYKGKLTSADVKAIFEDLINNTDFEVKDSK